MTYLKEIIASFYFGYWIYRNSQPFSFWWLILLFGGVYLFEVIISSIMKGSSKIIEKSADVIQKETIKIEDFNKRLTKLETQIHGKSKGGKE